MSTSRNASELYRSAVAGRCLRGAQQSPARRRPADRDPVPAGPAADPVLAGHTIPVRDFQT
jgi:hypothetical protein